MAQRNEDLHVAFEEVPQAEEASNYGSTGPAQKRKRVKYLLKVTGKDYTHSSFTIWQASAGTSKVDAGPNRPASKSSAISNSNKDIINKASDEPSKSDEIFQEVETMCFFSLVIYLINNRFPI